MKAALIGVIASAAVARAGKSLEDVAIAQHNTLRAKHGAGPLTWSEDLADIAQGHTSSCEFIHKTDGGSYGQNLYEQSFTGSSSPDPAECLSDGINTSWYASELPKFASNYGLASPSAGFSDWGHYTQIVWKSTTEVGCAYTSCKGFMLFECNYRVAGNMAGEYAKNVSPPGGNSTSSPYPTTTGSSAGSTSSATSAPEISWGNTDGIPGVTAASNNLLSGNWGGWRRALSWKRAQQ